MIYICCGAPRSGSTLQYNLVCELLELNYKDVRLGYYHKVDFQVFKDIALEFGNKPVALKSHQIEPFFYNKVDRNFVYFFYTFRDLRDVANSMIKKNNINFEDIFRTEFFDNYINFHSLAKKNLSKTYLSKYEDFNNSLLNELFEITKVLGFKVQTLSLEKIAEKLKINNIIKHTQSLIYDEKEFDQNSLFHKNHIYSGGQFNFLKDLKKNEIKLLEVKYANWLTANGYKLLHN